MTNSRSGAVERWLQNPDEFTMPESLTRERPVNERFDGRGVGNGLGWFKEVRPVDASVEVESDDEPCED